MSQLRFRCPECDSSEIRFDPEAPAFRLARWEVSKSGHLVPFVRDGRGGDHRLTVSDINLHELAWCDDCSLEADGYTFVQESA